MENYKHYFIGLENQHYLYTGAESPALVKSKEALMTYIEAKSLGEGGRAQSTEMENALIGNLAKILNSDESEISLTGNASEALNNIAFTYPFTKGANVILNDLEYPSVFYPFLSLQNQGEIEVRVAKHEQGIISIEAITQLIDGNTEMVVLSHVSFMNGFRHNLQELHAILSEKNIPLLVDATQSLGVIDIDSKDVDFLVASSYKWLLGAHGVGIMYISNQYSKRMKQTRIGWRNLKEIFFDGRFESYSLREDAKVFELGFNSYPTIYTLKHSTDLLLKIGIQNIEKYVLELGELLILRFKEHGYQLFTPEQREMRAGNISIYMPEGERYMEELEKQGIRIWGGDGRLRVSINFYNTAEDIEILIDKLNVLREENR